MRGARRGGSTERSAAEGSGLGSGAARRGAIYCAPACGGKCTWAALRAVMDGFHTLATRLQDLMRPEQIMKTLQNVKSLPLLPAPEPPAPKRRTKGT